MTIILDLLDEESAAQAIKTVGELAKANDIAWALVGGIAMALYGSDRNTKDVDIIATKPLPVSNEQIVGRLRQGGERYDVKTEKRSVAVDWIIRNDEFEHLFQTALQESVLIGEIPILTPEWLVILKFIAGRFKDREDAVFLLSRKSLVDRNLIKEKIINLLGRAAWGLAKHGYQRWYDIADGRKQDEERDEAEGYINS